MWGVDFVACFYQACILSNFEQPACVHLHLCLLHPACLMRSYSCVPGINSLATCTHLYASISHIYYCKHMLPLGGMVNCTIASRSLALTPRSSQIGRMQRVVSSTICVLAKAIVMMCFCMLICQCAMASDLIKSCYSILLLPYPNQYCWQGVYEKHALS